MESKDSLAAQAFWLQQIDGRSNIEIAEILSVSRLRVPKLIEWAEENELAYTSITKPAGVDWNLSDKLREKYSLSEALVSEAESVEAVANCAALYLAEILTDGSLLGVAWGTGTQAVVTQLEKLHSLPQCQVVQIIGGLPQVDGVWHGTELLVRLAEAFSGDAAALLSPMILPDIKTAQGLRQEPSIAHAFSLMNKADVVLVGVGSWKPGGSRVRSEISNEDLSKTKDVVADVCGVLLNKDGRIVHHAISDRIVSIGAQDLASRPVRMSIALGPDKVEAIKAALKSNLLSVLCTDAKTARLLLAD